MLPYRGRKALPPAEREPYKPVSEAERIRMSFKLSVLSAAIARGEIRRVEEANRLGLENMIALGQEWKVPVPEALWVQLKGKAA